jgi:hypothetical protein
MDLNGKLRRKSNSVALMWYSAQNQQDGQANKRQDG